MRVDQFDSQVRLLEIANRGKVAPSSEKKTAQPSRAEFQQTLTAELTKSTPVSFSKHASARLFSRGIELDQEHLAKLSGAVDKAAAKGAREALILDDNAAYVVSIENRTVISAFSRDNLREGVFTSIDSAVII